MTEDDRDPCLDAVAIDLAAPQQTSIIGAAIQALGRNEEDDIRGNQ